MWFHRNVLFAVIALLWTSTLARPRAPIDVAEPDLTASSPQACRVITGLFRVLQAHRLDDNWHTNKSHDTRVIAANHKTGTDFAKCVCSVLQKVHNVPCLRVNHKAGEGLTSDHFSVNMIRNPFEMVISGMQVTCVVLLELVVLRYS